MQTVGLMMVKVSERPLAGPACSMAQTVGARERPELTGGGQFSQVIELRQMAAISGAQQQQGADRLLTYAQRSARRRQHPAGLGRLRRASQMPSPR